MKFLFYILLFISSIASGQSGKIWRGGTPTVPPPIDTLPPVTGGDDLYERNNIIAYLDYETWPASSSTNSFKGFNGWAYPNSNGSAASYSKTQSSTHAFRDTYSGKYLLYNTDRVSDATCRTENNRASNSETSVNVKRWYGAAIYIETDTSDISAEINLQLHQVNGSGSPPLELRKVSNTWKIVSTVDGVQKETSLGAVAFNTWQTWVFEVQWDDSGTHGGYVKVYHNNVLTAVNGTGIWSGKNTYAGNTYGNYMKMGIYKWDWSKHPGYSSQFESHVFFDEVRVGNENAVYNDVAPEQIP